LFPYAWINGIPQSVISIADRGLQYGDGVFETMRMQNGCLPLLSWHLERLAASAARLSIPFDQPLITRELEQFVSSLSVKDAIIKIIFTRGTGERGYLPPEAPAPTRIFIANVLRDWSVLAEQGLMVRLCRQRIMELPEIAGLKILGRLDLVLARNEWRDTDIHEGLLMDSRDNIIEGTMSNVFLVSQDRLLTPSLETAGVIGVARRVILERLAAQIEMPFEERNISEDDLYRADEVFICNSVAGVMPVRQIEDHQFSSMKISSQLRKAFADFVTQHSAARL
jgi:4-amino-4-deoxychorismate lyase